MTTHPLPKRPVASIDELEQLRVRCEQLEYALHSRIVIEQAKGVLSERLGCDIDRAFKILRTGARSTQRRLHDLAAEVVASRETPASITAANGRLRARRLGDDTS